jgi:hypothetical protein
VTPPERLRRLVYRAHLAHHDNPKAVDNFFESVVECGGRSTLLFVQRLLFDLLGPVQ